MNRPSTETLRARWEQATAAADPLAALGASHGFGEQWDQWQRGVVADAVEAGATWEQVGLALGISRQAAWARFRGGSDGTGDEIGSKEQLSQARMELKGQVKSLIQLKKQRDEAWRQERAAAMEQVKLIDSRRAADQAALFGELGQLLRQIKSLHLAGGDRSC